MWEDEANQRGGKLILRLRKGLASRCWENLVLAMLGEQFMVGKRYVVQLCQFDTRRVSYNCGIRRHQIHKPQQGCVIHYEGSLTYHQTHCWSTRRIMTASRHGKRFLHSRAEGTHAVWPCTFCVMER